MPFPTGGVGKGGAALPATVSGFEAGAGRPAVIGEDWCLMTAVPGGLAAGFSCARPRWPGWRQDALLADVARCFTRAKSSLRALRRLYGCQLAARPKVGRQRLRPTVGRRRLLLRPPAGPGRPVGPCLSGVTAMVISDAAGAIVAWPFPGRV